MTHPKRLYIILGLLFLAQVALSAPNEPLPEGVTDTWLANLENLLAPGLKTGVKDYTPLWGGGDYSGESINARVGATIAPAGDVNGDGYSDVIVGAPEFQTLTYNRGKAWVFLGGPDGLESTPVWSDEGWAAGCDFGYAVACAGDVNNDGFDDIIVGEPSRGYGWVYLYLGRDTGVTYEAAWDYTPYQGPARFGASVATAGHFNNDDYDDFIVGCPNTYLNQGEVRLFRGSYGDPEGPSIYLGSDNSQLGTSVAFAGDINGDGYDDWVAGGPTYYAEDAQYVGMIRVIYGHYELDPQEIYGDLHHLGLGYDVAGVSRQQRPDRFKPKVNGHSGV